MNHTTYRSFYRDYMLTCRPQPQEDGRFQARVAISAMGGLKTRAQRFIDLAVFDSHDEAVECALTAGREWIDNNARSIASR